MPESRLLYVPLALLDELWPQLAPLIEQARALSCGEESLADIHARAEAKKLQLWAVLGTSGIRGVCVTDVVEYPQKRVLQIKYLAGRGFDEWGQAPHAEIEAFARNQGCSEIHVTGRAGWARKLAGQGYQEQYRVLRKVLE